ncbi:MAG: hypothetical protein MUO73_05255 [Thermoplasmata archaeon]|nr:hypothetical protein [Thermoplasmata archaeon]
MPWKDDIQLAREEYRKQQAKRIGLKRPQVKKKPSRILMLTAGIIERIKPLSQWIINTVHPYLHIVRSDLGAIKQKVSTKERTQEDEVKDQVKEIMRRMKK